jgi:YHS domain-containing protein
MRRINGDLDDGRVVFGTRPAAAQTKARDPVCGMLVDPSAAPHALHGGHSYFFCSPECKTKFETDPDRFLSGGAP